MVPGYDGLYALLDHAKRFIKSGTFVADAAIVISKSTRPIAGRITILCAAEAETDHKIEDLGAVWVYRSRSRLMSSEQISNAVTGSAPSEFFTGVPAGVTLADFKFPDQPEWIQNTALFFRGGQSVALRTYGKSGPPSNSTQQFRKIIESINASEYFEPSRLTKELSLRQFPNSHDSHPLIALEFELPISVKDAFASTDSASVSVVVSPAVDVEDLSTLISWSQHQRAVRATRGEPQARGALFEYEYKASYPAIAPGERVTARVLFGQLTAAELTLDVPMRATRTRAGTQRSAPWPLAPPAQERPQTAPTSDWGEIYEEIEEIGRGGFGRVLKVRDRGTNEERALKILETPAEDTERLEKEIRALTELDSPYIVRLLECCPQWQWYVMPLAESDLSRRGDELFEAHIFDLAICIATALRDVHAKELIHRDLSPGNVLWFGDEAPHWRLSDFGLVRRFPGRTTRRITTVGIGTPGYMSPEAVVDPHRVDHRTDLYSFGQLLGWAITGVEPVPQQQRNLAGNWVSLVSRLTSPRPEDRPQSAEEVLREVVSLRDAVLSREREQRLIASERVRLTAAELVLMKYLLVHQFATHDGMRSKQDWEVEVHAIFAAVDRLLRRKLVSRGEETDRNGDSFVAFFLTDQGRELVSEYVLELV